MDNQTRHDSTVGAHKRRARNVEQDDLSYLSPKNKWMIGMEEAEISAVQGLMRMKWDVRGVGLGVEVKVEGMARKMKKVVV